MTCKNGRKIWVNGVHCLIENGWRKHGELTKRKSLKLMHVDFLHKTAISSFSFEFVVKAFCTGSCRRRRRRTDYGPDLRKSAVHPIGA